MKRLLTTMVILLFILVGCTDENGQDIKDEGKVDSSNDVIVLKASSQAPPASGFSKGFDALLDEVEKQADGKIKFERYYSESLAKAANQFSALSSGIADIAVFVPSYTPAQLPLATISSSPGVWLDSWVGSKAINELYRTTPEMQEELEKENVKWIGQYAVPSYHIVSTKDISSIEQLKGQRLIATGQMATLAQGLGATVVGIPITEAYDAMQKGTIEGAVYGYTSSVTYGLEESAKSVWELPVGATGGLIAMNMDSWNKVPEDVKKIFEDVSANHHPSAYHEIYQIESDEAAKEKFAENGVKINSASEEDIEKMRKIARDSIWEAWIAEQEKNGLPGEEIMEKFLELVDKYTKENPYAK